MTFRNSSEQWGLVSIALHWLTFVLVLGMALLGMVMTELPTGLLKLQAYALHKNFGLLVLGLTALRLLWRLGGRPPDPLTGAPTWQHGVARGTHGALYLLLFLVPLSGWWYNSVSGFPLRWFGWLSLPALGAYDRQLKQQAQDTHELLFYALALTILIHAAAALWHHYGVKDRTLTRMLPLGRRPAPRGH